MTDSLRSRTPFLWLNPSRGTPSAAKESTPSARDVDVASDRWTGFRPLLATLFPELAATGGAIESPLIAADAFKAALGGRGGRWFIKADHQLPVAGSVKARGAIFEVLVHAEELARQAGLYRGDDIRTLATEPVRALFGRHRVMVGSTGNLALGVGIAAAALGFAVKVHMSSDAKPWKKERLLARGVEVVSHDGDFVAAVAAGRAAAAADPACYFIDDEYSPRLFLGYAAAAEPLGQQLAAAGVRVDAEHPLFVYIPCGVGGAPGGIAFGLNRLFGDHVHCFFAEPVDAPCMLARLSTDPDAAIDVHAFGLSGRTEADGLAVAQASEFVAPLMPPILSGIFTVPDDELFDNLSLLDRTEGLRMEPSAAAAARGPLWLSDSEAGQAYVRQAGLERHVGEASHIIWTTGGAFVPDDEYAGFLARASHLQLQPTSEI